MSEHEASPDWEHHACKLCGRGVVFNPSTVGPVVIHSDRAPVELRQERKQ